MNNITRDILRLIYPEKCLFCGGILSKRETHICLECDKAGFVKNIVRYPEYGQFFTKAVAPFYYRQEVRNAIRRYKFSASPQYSCAFAYFMMQSILINELFDADYVTYVPGRGRLARTRGYNQAKLLAFELYKCSEGRIKKPVELIKKVKKTAHQYEVTAQERAKNIMGAFMPMSNVDLKGGKVLLIDDVITTGATASECARCLLTLGASEVNIAAIASAVGGRECNC